MDNRKNVSVLMSVFGLDNWRVNGKKLSLVYKSKTSTGIQGCLTVKVATLLNFLLRILEDILIAAKIGCN